MTKVFLTGATGFLGRHVRRQLERGEGLAVAELSRARGADLLVPASYERELAGADIVLHLAAATGRAAPADHFRVNVEGTRILLEQSRRHGARRFVFVSSIAAKFPDIRRYPYARAKLEAEALVAGGGIEYSIIRPTIIAGPGAPVLAGLRRLAMLPIVPVFGTGRVRVQPIFVDDLADCLVSIVREGSAAARTIEIGGPDVITIERLLGELRRITIGKGMRAVHVPLAPVLACLALLEPLARGRLPVTAGQLATFRFDGIASPSRLFQSRRAGMVGASRMVELSFAA